MRLSGRWQTGGRRYVVFAVVPVLATALGVALDDYLGQQFDNYAYDFLFRHEPPKPWPFESIILAIDETTLNLYSGQYGIRDALADGLRKIAAARPAAVAVDVILAEPGAPDSDARLEQAFTETRNLVLASYVTKNDSWDEPLARFRQHAAAIGQVHAEFDPNDAVSRDLPLAKVAGHDRRWALAFDAFLAAKGLRVDRESPDDLVVGGMRIPTTAGEKHAIRLRYPPLSMGGIPRVSVAELNRDPSRAAQFAGKAVFAGETVPARDSWMTPVSYGKFTPGIEINADLYETLARRVFLTDVSPAWVVVASFAIALCAGFVYAFTGGWLSNVLAALLAIASQAIPAVAFSRASVWPWFPGTFAALFSISAAAAWKHLLVRRDLAQAEKQKTRYQQAMQFVTHEMRTPLTAIQGSSELIGRYAQMPEAKRKQMADLINSESKRLARMIETFLSVERLSAGQMELKKERFSIAELVARCSDRAQPIAERKRIEIDVEKLPDEDLAGDRELMEYAVYNLLTNAVKYSPPDTRVRVFGEDDRGDLVRLCVEDQGIGMDKKEVARIFEKFYRTRRAEQSGEAGSGIGLSIVEQIVAQHGGSIQVDSEPGKGSRFTLILKRA